MRFLSLLALCLALTACYPCEEYNREGENLVYQVRDPEDGYQPETGRTFKVAGFEIEQGQQMRDFFDDFEEPMHAKYVGNDVILWTYYVDYDRAEGKGRTVKYCELDKYTANSLCKLNVEFYKTYVRNVWTDCK